MAKNSSRKRVVFLTDRALKDIKRIEQFSVERFGERVTKQYLEKLEAGISLISENHELLRGESSVHDSLKFYRVEQHVFVCETAIESKIIILALLHASMDIPSRLADLEPTLRSEAEMLLKKILRT